MTDGTLVKYTSHQRKVSSMTVAEKNALIELAEKTMEIEPLEDYERHQMSALDRLTNNETDRLILRFTFWQVRAERLGIGEVAV